MEVGRDQEGLSLKPYPPEESGNRKSCRVLCEAPGITHSEAAERLVKDIMSKQHQDKDGGHTRDPLGVVTSIYFFTPLDLFILFSIFHVISNVIQEFNWKSW